jgi:phosphatidylglycerophosphatase A
MTDPRLLLVTTGGLGHLRPASGTWGSMPPVALAGALILAGCGPTTQPLLYHAALAAVFLLFGWACVAFGHVGETAYGRKDPSQVVADETCAQCIPLAFLPAAATATPARTAATLALAFVAFRIMDIIKPPPAHQLQRLRGGWGILVDDLFAGLYAAAVVQLVTRTAM